MENFETCDGCKGPLVCGSTGVCLVSSATKNGQVAHLVGAYGKVTFAMNSGVVIGCDSLGVIIGYGSLGEVPEYACYARVDVESLRITRELVGYPPLEADSVTDILAAGLWDTPGPGLSAYDSPEFQWIVEMMCEHEGGTAEIQAAVEKVIAAPWPEEARAKLDVYDWAPLFANRQEGQSIKIVKKPDHMVRDSIMDGFSLMFDNRQVAEFTVRKHAGLAARLRAAADAADKALVAQVDTFTSACRERVEL